MADGNVNPHNIAGLAVLPPNHQYLFKIYFKINIHLEAAISFWGIYLIAIKSPV